jgi:hypothetical protein
MDDNLDLDDITTTSFMSPISTPANKDYDGIDGPFDLGNSSSRSDTEDSTLLHSALQTEIHGDEIIKEDKSQGEDFTTCDPDESDEGEKTVVLPKPAFQPLPPLSKNGDFELSDSIANLPGTSSSKQVKLRINREVERIVVTFFLDKRLPLF